MSQQPQEPQVAVTLAECYDLARIMRIKYAASMRGRFFEVNVRTNADLAEVTVTLRNDDNSFYYPVEGRIEHRQQNISARDGALFVMDYIDSYFDEYLREDERVFLPIDWGNFQCEGMELQLKGQVLNLKCEALADELLAGASSSSQSPANDDTHSH